MAKGIYTYYKERLIEIGGNNKCLCLRSILRKSAYDVGKLLQGRDATVADFVDFLWSGKARVFPLIGQKEKREILENLDLESRLGRLSDTSELEGEEFDRAKQKNDRIRREEGNKLIEAEIAKIRELSRETEEIERETGRYELYIGYPFIFGAIQQGPAKTIIKAPLLLFPVRVDFPDENTVEISRCEAEKIQINRALILAYAQSKKVNIDQLELDFDDLSDFGSIKDVIAYLADAGIRFDCAPSRNVYGYARFKEPDAKTPLSVRYGAVLGRFPLANSIYHDYNLLERKRLSNDAIAELLRTEKEKRPAKPKKAKKPVAQENSYAVKMLDYAQAEVVRRVGDLGNMVIWGPPGTGKSQTIVNIITDALCKHKRVLVVSQKKAALDVVYNRLGTLNGKAMYLSDEAKEKQRFYDRCLTAHQDTLVAGLVDVPALEGEYRELQEKIDAETEKLDRIEHVLNVRRPFGLSLSEMYNASSMLAKNSTDYQIYQKMVECAPLMALDYKALSDALFDINAKNLAKTYYDFSQEKEKNPMIDRMKPGLDISSLSAVKGEIENLSKTRRPLFSIGDYPYYKQVLAYYKEMDSEKNFEAAVRMQCKFEHPKMLFRGKELEALRKEYLRTLDAIDDYAKGYSPLRTVLTEDGYLSVIDNVLRGNTAYLKLVSSAIDGYISDREIGAILEKLAPAQRIILEFAYANGKNYQHYLDVIGKVLELRIYHEVLRYEEEEKEALGLLVDFPNVSSRIYKLREEQLAVANRLCEGKSSKEYETLYETAKNNKDYLYQISKKQKYWPIRKTMETFGNFLLCLFPCWLLSPENVSNLLPLEQNLFDLVIFDEASQVFIESTIPTIYRGKNIVVAGDEKQLRPSATFLKRYLGGDPENQEDLSVQAALEVDSLLDLAIARYECANLTYHYRSRSRELIDFSNAAFYGMNLQIAPNATESKSCRPIERYKVAGKWIDRKNDAEAKKIVSLLGEIFATRKHNESIGIITFNADQQSCIADAIDKACAKDPDFRSKILAETHRIEDGEDVSLFIKNLENVQGDERDIVIFSIGYAENETGRVYTNFGSLSTEGGENRLNVAITRAKTKIIVVTSIEPEDLKVDGAKNQGPKLLRDYLTYVRAVADGKTEEAKRVLESFDRPEETEPARLTGVAPIEEQLAERIEKAGFKAVIGLGDKNSRISLAVYDEKSGRYLVGVELDRDAFASSSAAMERDVYKPKFLESRGWTILRVFCRDFWLSPGKVTKAILSVAEHNRDNAN